ELILRRVCEIRVTARARRDDLRGRPRSLSLRSHACSFLLSAHNELELVGPGLFMSLPFAAKRACALLCFVMLLSCGGGGGGGGDPLAIRSARIPRSWPYLEGENVGPQTVTGTAPGTYDGELFVGAIVENNGAVNAINPEIAILIDGNRATATIFPSANLAAG